MKIYSMTATFGKLEHETLTLEPGLNIVEAPNEWGKSTWCAFLIAMLYGIDTREKTTKANLAIKERYSPWSGSPMSGRMDIHWNGRDITIERSSKGRTPMGVFRAYETQSGIEIPELTAANCGQQLLGVEQSVFVRSGFLRFSDLPVTEDKNLRSRLNALVTTGDESGSAEALGQKLRELKNHCRYNRSGLLPQAEAQRDQLERKLQEYDSLASQSERHRTRSHELEQWISQLKNHKAALRYAASQDDEKRVAEATAARDAARNRYEELESTCRDLPQRQEAEQAIQNLNILRQQWDSLHMEEQMLPALPDTPETPELFRGMTPEEAVTRAEADKAAMAALKEPKKPISTPLLAIGALAAVAGVVLLILQQFLVGIPVLCVGAVLAVIGFIMNQKYKTDLAAVHGQRTALCHRYGSNDPANWTAAAHAYLGAVNDYHSRLAACRKMRGDLDSRREALRQKIGTQSLGDSLAYWNRVLTFWDELADARRALQQAERHLQTLQAMAKTAEPPTEADELTYSVAETDRILSDAAYEQQQLHTKLGQCLGQMNALGNIDALRKELDAVNRRIGQLELIYAALEYAQNALSAASAELQRRFAPRISRRAEELFSQLTGGRYDRLTLTEDLSVLAGAEGEDTLHTQQWRSDGTIDQLYLALRLAVAQELTPDAPLILDDALVRFDDTRLATALEILRRESEQKQVILFTCQGREKKIQEE